MSQTEQDHGEIINMNEEAEKPESPGGETVVETAGENSEIRASEKEVSEKKAPKKKNSAKKTSEETASEKKSPEKKTSRKAASKKRTSNSDRSKSQEGPAAGKAAAGKDVETTNNTAIKTNDSILLIMIHSPLFTNNYIKQ